MTRFLERRTFCITTLSPLHLGDGTDLDWTSAYIDGQTLVIFDPLRLTLEEKVLANITKACEESNGSQAILKLQKIYNTNKPALKRASTSTLPLPQALAKILSEKLGNSQRNLNEIDEINIARTASNTLNRQAYIPGSGIKGALRTAWPNTLPMQKTSENELKEAAMLGGSYHEDPFRLIHLEDASPTRENLTIVALARNVRRKGDKKGKGIPVKIETVCPFMAGAFQGALRCRDLGKHPGPKAPTAEDLFKASNKFHQKLFNDQLKDLEQLSSVSKKWLEAMKTLLKEREDNLNSGTVALLRLGKFGTAESKTVEGRSISVKVAKNKSENRPNGTTFWLAGDKDGDGLLPLGWVLLEQGQTPSEDMKKWCESLEDTTALRPLPLTQKNAPEASAAQPALSEEEKKIKMVEDTLAKNRPADDLISKYAQEAQNWTLENRTRFLKVAREKGLPLSKPEFKRKTLAQRLEKLEKL